MNTTQMTPAALVASVVASLGNGARITSDANGRAECRIHNTGRSYCRFNASADVLVQPHLAGGFVAVVTPLVGSSMPRTVIRNPSVNDVVAVLSRRCPCSLCQ
jgi:hypothetical protein